MIDPKIKPIQRSEHLAPLSREHHEGLLLAWKIRQGLQKGINCERIIVYCNWFFNQYLAPHFLTEEESFSAILDKSHPLLLQMFEEHQTIKKTLKDLSNETSHSKVALLEFANLIQLHIRFEERILFNHIESILSEQELSRLDIHSHSPTVEWKDPFWL